MNPNCVWLTIGHMAKEAGVVVLIAAGFVLLIGVVATVLESISDSLNRRQRTKKALSMLGGSLAVLMALAFISFGSYVWFMEEYSKQCPFSPVSIAWVKAHPPTAKATK